MNHSRRPMITLLVAILMLEKVAKSGKNVKNICPKFLSFKILSAECQHLNFATIVFWHLQNGLQLVESSRVNLLAQKVK